MPRRAAAAPGRAPRGYGSRADAGDNLGDLLSLTHPIVPRAQAPGACKALSSPWGLIWNYNLASVSYGGSWDLTGVLMSCSFSQSIRVC